VNYRSKERKSIINKPVSSLDFSLRKPHDLSTLVNYSKNESEVSSYTQECREQNIPVWFRVHRLCAWCGAIGLGAFWTYATITNWFSVRDTATLITHLINLIAGLGLLEGGSYLLIKSIKTEKDLYYIRKYLRARLKR